MTGAPIPEGANAVVPVEDTDQRPGAGPLPTHVELQALPKASGNVRHAGEDVAPGDVVAAAGERVDAMLLAAALSVGCAEVEVARRPRVAVLSTGDELVDAGAELAPGRIPDSNGPMLAELLRAHGAEPVRLAAVSDDVEVFSRTLESAADVDLIVTTGGVSAGAFEVVRHALEPRGVEFVSVAMQPGKPQGCGEIDIAGRRTPVVCLPGNPMSVFVSFHTFVVPLLDRFTGALPLAPVVPVTAGHGWHVPRGRTQIAPAVVRLEDGALVARLPNDRGARSHFIGTLHRANALVTVDGVDAVRPGDVLEARLLGPLGAADRAAG